MICVTKPLLVNGHTDFAQTAGFIPGEYIDGAIISRNFQEIYRTLNGRLHAVNFNNYLTGARKKDKYIQFQEFHYDTSPVAGMGHSHNGVDSAPLGYNAVNMQTTQLRGFGSWQMPSARATCLTLHGSARITMPGGIYDAPSNSTVQTLLIDLPYDLEKYTIYSTSVTNTRARCFVQARCSDPSLGIRVTHANGKIFNFENTVDHSKAPYIRAYVRYSGRFETMIQPGGSGSPKYWVSKSEASGLWLDWIATFMVYRVGLVE